MPGPDYLKLLELAIDEEHFFTQAHDKRIAFYSSLISAVIAVSAAGFLKAETRFDYLLILLGPATIFALAHFAIKGTHSLYRRFVESVIVRAKLEQQLGLTNKPRSSAAKGAYWHSEPLVAPRQIDSRNKTRSSREFFQKYEMGGYNRTTMQFFSFFKILAVALGVLILWTAWSSPTVAMTKSACSNPI